MKMCGSAAKDDNKTFGPSRVLRLATVTVFALTGTPGQAQTAVSSTDKTVSGERVRQLEKTLADVQAQLDAIRSSLAVSGNPQSNEQQSGTNASQHGAPASIPGLTTPSVKAVDPEAVPNGLPPIGNVGWLPDISTNLSYVGIRGTQVTGLKNLDFVYLLETQIDISATSGTAESNSSQSNQVKGGLTSRNSYIGLGSPKFGALVFGKTDAPYKLSTARLNPFFAMLGDYQVIMGNTGGDNRVEFGTRLDHSIWFTSNKLGGFEINTLFSPGQNRSGTSDNIAAGEADCTGIDIPGSGGSLPYACNDGAFSDAVSSSLSYTKEPLYLLAAYERHLKVNRQSGLTGLYASVPTAYLDASVADEDTAKLGAHYTFGRKTVVSAIYEMMHRYFPYFLEFQNERQRSGSWLALTQVISPDDSISMGWARAYRTPGDQGQHNTSLELPPLGAPAMQRAVVERITPQTYTPSLIVTGLPED